MDLKESKALSVQGTWTIKCFKHGEFMFEHTQKNLIVNSGLLIIAKLIASQYANAEITNAKFGDGTGDGSDVPVPSDVAMKSTNWLDKTLNKSLSLTTGANIAKIYWEVAYDDDIDVVNGAITYSGGFPTGSPFQIVELGLFSANDDMFNRIKWTGPDLLMDAGIKLEGYFTFEVTTS